MLSLTSVILQAYDDRIQRAQLNKQFWDDERERRNKEREEWARQAKERSEARMKTRTDLYENIRKIKEEKEIHSKLVDQFYQELCDRNPEWEIRKQEVLKVLIFLRSSTAFSYDRPIAQRDAREGTVIHTILHPLVTFYGRIFISLCRSFVYF